MKNTVYFAMGVHFHQPVGNLEAILERAYNNCYRPFLEVFAKYPDLKLTFHFSGNLLDYFERSHPEFLDLVRKLSAAGQVEIMGGGYYEPIFPAIPEQDRVGQIQMLSDYCEKNFGLRPAGLWIPERVWSPDLITNFRGCGITYSVLDNIHLIKAGINQGDMYGYFTTGDDDNKIAVFPTDKTLRYIIPFKSPRMTISYFKKAAKKKNAPLFTLVDDGEKFGEWPWTYNWVYKKKWLHKFFGRLVKSKGWIKTVTFSEYLGLYPPLRDIYIPEASYDKMLEWSGGSWMNFLSRYPESNQMHKRMWYVSERIERLNGIEHSAEGMGDLDDARRELYKGQCNCAYWHGAFGGIYLRHLRNAIYEHLVNADRIADRVEYKDDNNRTNIKKTDFYRNGRPSIIAENKDFFICIDPARGGTIRELDCKDTAHNFVNTFARRKEPYHKKILDRLHKRTPASLEPYEAIKTINKDIRDGIFYDAYDRVNLLDHFISRDVSMEDFMNCNYIDKGDFADASYTADIEKEKIILSREGNLDGGTVSVAKEITIGSDKEIGILYALKNKSDVSVDASFGVEFNMVMPEADFSRYSYETDKEKLGKLDSSGAVSEAGSFSIRDSQGGLGIGLMFSQRPEKIWFFPVMTVSQSERAYDLNYQATCMFPIWDIKLGGGEETRFSITWSIK